MFEPFDMLWPIAIFPPKVGHFGCLDDRDWYYWPTFIEPCFLAATCVIDATKAAEASRLV